MPEPFPSSLVPMLATAGAGLPDDPHGEWAYELKWDGVRALAYLHDGRLRLESRNLNDITPRYPELHGLVEARPGQDLLLDGEVVAFDPAGRPSFSLLQTRMHVQGDRYVAALVGQVPIAYLIFDVLHVDGSSTRDLPWTERRALLESLELQGPGWQTPKAHVGAGVGPAVLEASQAGGLEGVMAKLASSTYTPGRRTKEWRKIKNVRRQELVVGGWLPGAGNRTGRIGALLVGYHDEAGLRFAGKVGTGFSDAELRRLGARFEALARDASPFVDKVPYRQARYLDPSLVCEVEFTEWTHTATLRHPSYKGLRDDKPAAAVVRED
ncbi:MAG TPA: non-homologous end-joining DNA ligase [Acidimicrobiales bacterium]|nr:non-homologous end-joining DNA ligase [Acidimicrobiales bacterium]